MRTRPVVAASLTSLALVVGPVVAARADAEPPSQALAGDPEVPVPGLALSVDAGAAWRLDDTLRVEGATARWLSVWGEAGASERHGGVGLLLQAGLSVWPMAEGLEGPWLSPSVGVSLAGPWNGEDPTARSVWRAGIQAGWQFTWEGFCVALGGGASVFVPLEGRGAPSVEPGVRAALGLVWR